MKKACEIKFDKKPAKKTLIKNIKSFENITKKLLKNQSRSFWLRQKMILSRQI